MICGVVTPTSGAVHVIGEIHALLSLGTGFHPDFTGQENVYSYLAHLGIVGRDADKAFREIVEFSELHEFIDQPVKTYSAGMGVRLMFSAATVITPDIIVIDEVLGAGDAYFTRKSFDRMKELCEGAGTTLLMVTHDLYAASMFCERMIWIDRGKIKMDGPSTTVLRAYEELIRDQEEQRLRAIRLATVKANLKDTSDEKLLMPAFIRLAPGDNQPPDIAISHLRFFAGETLLAEIALDGRDGDESSSTKAGAVLVIDPREGNWGEVETIEGRQARRMLPYGSIFHKLPLIITDPAVGEAVRQGRLAVEIGCLACRTQTIEFGVLERNGETLAIGQLGVLPEYRWQDVRARLTEAADRERTLEDRVAARHGQRAMEITDVRFLDALGTERMQFMPGSCMRVKFSYRLNKPDFHEKPTIIAAFQQNGILRSHRFWTDRILISARDAPEGELEIVADPLLLGAGTYFVTISVFAEGYMKSDAPKVFFSANDQLYDMHARAYEVTVKQSATEPFCNDVIFQHPSTWFLNGDFAAESRPHIEEALEAEYQPTLATGDA